MNQSSLVTTGEEDAFAVCEKRCPWDTQNLHIIGSCLSHMSSVQLSLQQSSRKGPHHRESGPGASLSVTEFGGPAGNFTLRSGLQRHAESLQPDQRMHGESSLRIRSGQVAALISWSRQPKLHLIQSLEERAAFSAPLQPSRQCHGTEPASAPCLG